MISSGLYPGFGIKGTGIAFPEEKGKWINNLDIHKWKHGDDWFKIMSENKLDPHYQKTKYGFEKRFWVSNPFLLNNTTASTSLDLLLEAAKNSFKDSGLEKKEIGYVITFSATSPFYISSTATRVAAGLGLNCPAFEIKAGCSSGIYAMSLAYTLLAAGCKNVLLAGADTLSKVLDSDSSLLYAGGDGGASIIIGNVAEYSRGLFASYFESDGNYADLMHIPGILPPLENVIIGKEFKLQYESGLNHILESIWEKIPNQLYQASTIKKDEIDYFIPHHVNQILMEKGRKASGVAEENTGNYINDIGNIGASGVYYALHRSIKEKRVKPGDAVMLAAVGGGLNWGGLVLRV